MRNYEIRINIDNLLIYSESLRPQISNEELVSIIRSFSSYVRRLYLSMLDESIYSKRYKGEWEPREEEGYIEYLGTNPSDQPIINLMYEALEVREIKNNIVIRFNPDYKYPGSSLSLLKVLIAIDNGTSKFNARPIIKVIIRQLQSNILTLWRGYLKKKGVA